MQKMQIWIWYALVTACNHLDGPLFSFQTLFTDLHKVWKLNKGFFLFTDLHVLPVSKD